MHERGRQDCLLPARPLPRQRMPADGLRCTLPSEAKWEYACRVGSGTPFAFGKTLTPELANDDGNDTYAKGPKGECRQQTTPIGSFSANDWGLQDMHGNM